MAAPFEYHPAAYTVALRNVAHTGSRLEALFNDPRFFVFAPTPPAADALRLLERVSSILGDWHTPICVTILTAVHSHSSLSLRRKWKARRSSSAIRKRNGRWWPQDAHEWKDPEEEVVYLIASLPAGEAAPEALL
ncbi:MAG: hypothetical protein WA434_15345, partial [Candidatus Acidiferrales bacterium]